jgi:hypothetical protein
MGNIVDLVRLLNLTDTYTKDGVAHIEFILNMFHQLFVFWFFEAMMLFLFYVLCIGFSCFRVCFQSLCFCCTLASVRGGVRERVCSSTCCVTSRACVNIRMYLFVFECDTNMTSIQFELRTSALRVLPLSTGLTAYRRYQI